MSILAADPNPFLEVLALVWNWLSAFLGWKIWGGIGLLVSIGGFFVGIYAAYKAAGAKNAAEETRNVLQRFETHGTFEHCRGRLGIVKQAFDQSNWSLAAYICAEVSDQLASIDASSRLGLSNDDLELLAKTRKEMTSVTAAAHRAELEEKVTVSVSFPNSISRVRQNLSFLAQKVNENV